MNNTRRNVFQRASSAANDDATATFSSKVKRNSRTEEAVSTGGLRPQVTLANPLGEVKPVGQSEKNGKPVESRFLLYCSFPMTAKSRQGRRAGKKSAGVRKIAEADLPTRYGRFTIFGFESREKKEEAVALVRGNLNGKTVPLVRVHSQCLTGDVLTSLRCDCRSQLELSLKKIGRAASGILLYLPQEGRGIGLMNKLRAYQLQDGGKDTVEANEKLGYAAEARENDYSAEVLKKLGAKRIRLLSNNPEKVRQLKEAGIHVVERVPCQPRVSKISHAYLKTKKRKMGHILKGM